MNMKSWKKGSGSVFVVRNHCIKKNDLEAVAALSEELPIKNESIDLIISNHAVPWHIANDIEKVDKSLEEMIRVLKHGGEIRLNPVDEGIFNIIRDVVNRHDNLILEPDNIRYGDREILVKIRKIDQS